MSWIRVSMIALICAVTMQAQEIQQPRYAERVDVSRVIVDVRAVDDWGNPVVGLGPDDFEVKLDGAIARVESAFWVGGSESEREAGSFELASNEAAAGAPGSIGRLIVFLFQKDLEPSRITGLMQMLMKAQGLLDSLSPRDRIAILSFDSHLKIWTDFTNDRERLRQPLRRGVLFERPPPFNQSASISLLPRLDEAKARRAYGIEKSLELIANALEPLPGSKSIVLFGYGIGRFGATGVMMERGYEPARRALLAARASVFSLDVTRADYHSLEVGLQLVAEQTGGFYARTHVFPDQAMRRLAGALAGYYVLFVEKPKPGRDSHEIDVRLTRRKGTVLARSNVSP